MSAEVKVYVMLLRLQNTNFVEEENLYLLLFDISLGVCYQDTMLTVFQMLVTWTTPRIKSYNQLPGFLCWTRTSLMAAWR